MYSKTPQIIYNMEAAYISPPESRANQPTVSSVTAVEPPETRRDETCVRTMYVRATCVLILLKKLPHHSIACHLIVARAQRAPTRVVGHGQRNPRTHTLSARGESKVRDGHEESLFGGISPDSPRPSSGSRATTQRRGAARCVRRAAVCCAHRQLGRFP